MGSAEPRQLSSGAWRFSCPAHEGAAVSWNPDGDHFFASCHCERGKFREVIEQLRAGVTPGKGERPVQVGVGSRNLPASPNSNGKGGDAHQRRHVSSSPDKVTPAAEVADGDGESQPEDGDVYEPADAGTSAPDNARPAVVTSDGGPFTQNAAPNRRLAACQHHWVARFDDEEVCTVCSETRLIAKAPKSHSNGFGGRNGAGPKKDATGGGWEQAAGGFRPLSDEEKAEFARREELDRWKGRIGILARNSYRVDPEFHKAHLTWDLVSEYILQTLHVAMDTDSHGSARLAEYLRPAWCTQSEAEEEADPVAQREWEEFRRLELNDILVGRAKGTEKPPPPEPEETEPPIEVLELDELYSLIDEWDRQPWVWDGVLPHSSLSLIVGKSETGKSTLIYSLIHSIVLGIDFLGRRCEQGRVVYIAGDPASEIVAGKTFRELNITDGVTVIRGALATHTQGMKVLRETVKKREPVLVIADTLAATVAIDVDKYGQSYAAQQPLSVIAREFKPNFLMSHHSQKSAIDSYSVIDAALGSVGVAAVASSRMGTKCYRRAGQKFYTFEMSSLRIGRPLEGEWIVHKYANGLVDLAGLWKSRSVDMDKELITKALQKKGHGLSKRTLWQELRPKPKWEPFNDALDQLIASGQVTVGPNKGKGGGDIFSLGTQEGSSDSSDSNGGQRSF